MPFQPFQGHDSGPIVSVPPVAPAGRSESADELHAKVARLETDLIATQRLAMLGTMSAMFAHEINNLVTPVQGWTDLALRTRQVADMQKALERCRERVQQVVSISQRLLEMARGDKRPLGSCSVAAAVQAAIEAATRPFEKDRITPRLSVPEDLQVRAQFGLLVQVLLNLLLNARQAIGGSGGELRISARRDGQHAIIDVSDTGKGIAPERLAKVINPFLAGADTHDPLAWQSVGLGLNVCRMIASKHEATIQGLPNEGRGCTFRLRWPAG